MAEYFTGVWCETAGTDFGSRWTGYTLGSCFRRCWCSTDCYHECRKDTENDKIKEKATETSKQIEEQLTSKENMNKSTYVLDMKMTREKQRNDLSEELNEIISNPSTTDKSREEASNMKLQLVKYQEIELKIENLLSAKGFENALVYIGEDNVNVVVNKEDLTKSEAAKIFDLVSEQTGVSYDKIKLMNSYNQK